MSNRALTWAFDQPIRNAGRKFVLVALADKADEAHSCWPGQALIAEMTGQSERSVRDHLAWLEDNGYITRTMRRVSGRRSSDRYVLAVQVAVTLIAGRSTTPTPTTELPEESAGSEPATLAAVPDALPAKAAGSQPATLSITTGNSRRVTQREPSIEPTPSSSGPAAPDPATKPGPDDSPSALVVELCNLLADKIEANGSKRPTVGKGWYAACRLMIEQDKREPDKIRNAIKWCQNDEFWRANILSMPKLREKYDQMRLSAERGSRPAGRGTPPARLTAAQARERRHALRFANGG